MVAGNGHASANVSLFAAVAYVYCAAGAGIGGHCIGNFGIFALGVSADGQRGFTAAHAGGGIVAGDGAAGKAKSAVHGRHSAEFAAVAADSTAAHIESALGVNSACTQIILGLTPVSIVIAADFGSRGGIEAIAGHCAVAFRDSTACHIEGAAAVHSHCARHRGNAAGDGDAAFHVQLTAAEHLNGAGVGLGVVGVIHDGYTIMKGNGTITRLEHGAFLGVGKVAVKGKRACAHTALRGLAYLQCCTAGDDYTGFAGVVVRLAAFSQRKSLGEYNGVVIADIEFQILFDIVCLILGIIMVVIRIIGNKVALHVIILASGALVKLNLSAAETGHQAR